MVMFFSIGSQDIRFVEILSLVFLEKYAPMIALTGLLLERRKRYFTKYPAAYDAHIEKINPDVLQNNPTFAWNRLYSEIEITNRIPAEMFAHR